VSPVVRVIVVLADDADVGPIGAGVGIVVGLCAG